MDIWQGRAVIRDVEKRGTEGRRRVVFGGKRVNFSSADINWGVGSGQYGGDRRAVAGRMMVEQWRGE